VGDRADAQELAVGCVDYDAQDREWAVARGVGEPAALRIYGNCAAFEQALAFGSAYDVLL
jgi:hypothetical protein